MSPAPLPTRWINLEFASACNLRCKWCSLDHAKPKQVMSPELLERVVRELVEDPGFQLDRIELHNGGETLMHPDLGAMLAVLARHRDALPPVHLLTNAGLLTEEKARLLLDSGALELVRFSLDGGTRAAFEELRAPARWDKVHANVSRFLELNAQAAAPVRTGVICLVDPAQSLETGWMEPEFQELFGRIDQVNVRWPHNWDGSVELGIDDASYRAHAARRANRVCYFLELDLVVLPEGDVTVCCADLNGRGVLGNVRERSLRALVEGRERARMLELFAAGRKDELELCRGCTGYYR
ncbi:MAG: radical SAM protein [Planctomycetes bacterium]|nr:radical SAM protein [Planctomycetota bacterium]